MTPITQQVVAALAELDTCTVSNIIDELDVRLRNQGFCDGTIRCIFPQMPPVCGYAVTCTVRSADTPMEGHSFPDRTDWWDFIRSQPGPRILVLEDIDRHPGVGAFVGEIHGNILRALGSIACVTNGSVRSLPAAERIGLQLFATSVVVSHSFAHITSYGRPVVVGGLEIKTGDLLHGDRHGVLMIPPAVAAEIPGKAEEVLRHRQRIIDYCHAANISLDRLRQLVDEHRWSDDHDPKA